MTQKSYWDHSGTFQALYEELHKLLPQEGPVAHARGKNKRLEKMRVAANAYYDVYNNGGCNHGGLIRRIFNLKVGDYQYAGPGGLGRMFRWENAYRKTEPVMDTIILEAAVEQGLISLDVAPCLATIVK